MSPYQVAEMERTRKIPEVVEIRAPIAGFILYRNVSPGLRFDRGTEFFRIADLSRVWIQADIFETEAAYFKPGMRVKMELPYQKRTLYGEISPVLPQFDPATRTLKVRLEADNPGYVMRPDMFVNVELPVSGPPAIIVPVDAVLDSGLKKTVFVDKGNGFFEPRQVETGRSLGERVEIARGLMPGEKIVVSGNFLIDSEARMQQAASGIIGKIGRDPVCRMNIDEDRAKAEGNVREYKGKSYFFCSPECREDFGKDPERYLKPEPVQAKMQMPMAGSQGATVGHPTHDMAPKPPGMKTAPVAHDGMAMPGGDTGAMPGMNAPHPKSEPKAGKVATPGSATSEPGGMLMPVPQDVMPGMTQQRTIPGPGQGSMPMPQEATPMPDPRPDRPSPSPVVPGMGPGSPASAGPGGMPMPGTPGAMPMPGGKAGAMFPPVTGAPGMVQSPPAFPTQGGMPGPMPQEGMPQPGAQSGEIAPPAPVTRTPRINPRSQRYRVPGTAPQAGPQEASPMPGSKVRGTPSTEAGTRGMNRESPPLPSPGGVPLPGPQETTPMPGMKAKGMLPSATDAPEVNQ